jgi:AcrR family transcriptional regulator
MSSTDKHRTDALPRPRRRLSREERHRQLLDVSWRLIREEGTDALTLGRLAEQAGVAKPVVYDHFGTRPGLLAELYREFDDRQTAQMETALRESGPALSDKAKVMAVAFIDCVLTQGREIPDVIAALASSPELEKVKHKCQVVFMDQCRSVLTPFVGAGTIASASLWAMLGAAETLSYAAATGEISASQAESELFEIILAMVARNTR